MEKFIGIVNWVSGIVWGPYMIGLLVGTGIFLTFRLRLIQIKFFKTAFKEMFSKIFAADDGDGEIKPFHALTTALSSCVGVGNIVGVATAIAAGGPGAIFWMWISGFFGMATKYSEITLALRYRQKDEDGVWRGGAMYVLKNALNWKWAGVFFAAVTAFVGLISTNMVQSNSVAAAVEVYGIPPIVTGIILSILTFVVIFGGVKRLGKVTSVLTPIMASVFVFTSLIIIIINYKAIVPAFSLIFSSAFSGQAATGGFIGVGVRQAVRFGVSRGIFSNEAGIGSSPMIHAAAKVDHPSRQGLYGLMEVFFDTGIICTVTALVIITTGAWETGLTGSQLSTKAFQIGLPGQWGGIIISLCVTLFAYSTLLGWSWYGETAAEYIFGKKAILPYRSLWIVCTFIGAIANLNVLWLLADTVNGFMAIPNLISLLVLSSTTFKLTKDFTQTKINQLSN